VRGYFDGVSYCPQAYEVGLKSVGSVG
jgi:hypothetical protein